MTLPLLRSVCSLCQWIGMTATSTLPSCQELEANYPTGGEFGLRIMVRVGRMCIYSSHLHLHAHMCICTCARTHACACASTPAPTHCPALTIIHVRTPCRYTVDYVGSNDSTANLNSNRLRERFEEEDEDEDEDGKSSTMTGAQQEGER